MEHECSLRFKEEPAAFPCHEADQFSQCPHTIFQIQFNIIFQSKPGSYKRSFLVRFPNQIPLRTSLLPYPRNKFDSLTLTIFGEQCKT